ncbi:MAG TPA: TIM barrel protein [Thermomicrobiales bacterium]|nr:TIM barrel protein [Thermomicrobiales bacterium]
MRTIEPTTAWWCLAGVLTSEQIIETTASLGYPGIEFAPREQWDAIRDAGLRIVCVRGHDDISNGLNDLSQHDRIEREILANLKLAQQYGIPSLVCFSGERKGQDDAAGQANTIAALQRVSQAAEEAGVLLALELLNSKVDHPDYQCDRTAWGIEVVSAVDSPAVKLLYDVYHMQIMEGDIIRTIGAHHQHFGHYHLAGNPGRHDPDETQELFYPPILDAIEATGYTGYMGLEYIPSGDPVASLRKAIQLFQ